ncbi:metallophosphoesterase [Marinibaculum pumilum]|uniref:Metallophosphoesterase n=1 Tax=Marinibaculum pumilum TaxID=1766165 RepID=A0ABV7LAH2_9PROT
MTRSYHFIGDVHGLPDALERLLAVLAPAAGDLVVLLGDLLDKGPDSVGAVRLARELATGAAHGLMLLEGNHEDLYRRYRRNRELRPDTAAAQAARHPGLAAVHDRLSATDIDFLDAALPFLRVPAHGLLALHGGIPGDMRSFPPDAGAVARMTAGQRRRFNAVLRTGHVSAADGRYLMSGHEGPGDPFWADIYDGRFGHVIFGHIPFMDGPAIFPHATGLDTGAVQGGRLTALSVGPDGSRRFAAVPGR